MNNIKSLKKIWKYFGDFSGAREFTDTSLSIDMDFGLYADLDNAKKVFKNTSFNPIVNGLNLQFTIELSESEIREIIGHKRKKTLAQLAYMDKDKMF